MDIDYNFNGSLLITDVIEDFFYSPSTGLYVFRHPLIVDERLLKEADSLGIALHASPEKWLVNATLAECLRLLEALGSTAMTLPVYFKVRKDALAAGDLDMVRSLESDRFIEMLGTVFVRDARMIHEPVPDGSGGFTGGLIPVETPRGRYGWFHPDDVDPGTGLPTKVGYLRTIGDDTFK